MSDYNLTIFDLEEGGKEYFKEMAMLLRIKRIGSKVYGLFVGEWEQIEISTEDRFKEIKTEPEPELVELKLYKYAIGKYVFMDEGNKERNEEAIPYQIKDGKIFIEVNNDK